MRFSRESSWIATGGFALAAIAIALSQCILLPEEDLRGEATANRRPLAWIASGVIEDSTDVGGRVRFRWWGMDTDGVVRWFEWAVDDTVTEDAWTRTTGFHETIGFRATEPAAGSECSDWHTFFLRSVDNEGARSLADRRYFNAHTIAPSSRIVSPTPRAGAKFASTLRITWEGEDLDCSRDDQRPAWFEYKLVRFGDDADIGDEEKLQQSFAESTNVFFRLLNPADFPPDSAGDYFAQARRAWVRIAGSAVSEARITNLDIGSIYGFAVRAIDEAGAVEPDFVRHRNWMLFSVGNERVRVTLCEPSLGCETYDNALFEKTWQVTVAPEQPIRFRWQGDASLTGSEPGASNYGFDLADPLDDSRHDTNGMGGWIGWGNWMQTREAISFPHSEGGQTHYFYLKMRDVTNLPETETNCVVAIYVAKLSFTRKFLIIDDLFYAPKPCVGAPPSDEESDALRLEVLGDAMQDLLPAGDSWYELATFGDEIYGDAVDLPEDFLETLGAFQTTIWDCGSAQPVGLIEAIVWDFFSRYVEAGGNLMLFCDQGPVTQTIGFQHIAPEPSCPRASGAGSSLWTPGSGFLWELLCLRGCVDKPRHRSGSVRDMAPQSMIRAEALHPLYPDLVLDPQRWRCGSVERGIVRFEGLIANPFEPDDDPWYEREAAAGELELLYCARTLEAGSSMDSLPVAWRSPASWADTLSGFQRGRTVNFTFQPYFFDEGNVKSAMTFALRWLVTGSE